MTVVQIRMGAMCRDGEWDDGCSVCMVKPGREK